jgi:hypothetical protein
MYVRECLQGMRNNEIRVSNPSPQHFIEVIKSGFKRKTPAETRVRQSASHGCRAGCIKRRFVITF